MIRRHLVALLVAALGTTGLAVVTAAPASAAACERGTGVTVVVDGNQLGGLSTTCVPGGGRSATSAFSAAGVSMTYAARQQGFVCRVNGAPANAGCVNASPANAYWSLWTSSGNGSWTYASTGVGSTSVPAGGWVAWSWQGQSARSAPSVSPQGPAPAPAPTAAPATRAPSGSGSGSVGGSAGSGAKQPASQEEQERAEAAEKTEAAAEEKAAAKKDAAATKGAATSTPGASASTPGETAEARATSASSTSGAPWGTVVGIVAVLVLLAAAGVLAWRRRSSAP